MTSEYDLRIQRLEETVEALSKKLALAAPTRAYRSPTSEISELAEVAPSVRFHGTVKVGKYTRIKRDAEITESVIGEYSSISRGVTMRPQTYIGNRVLVGSFALLMTGTHEIGTSRQRAMKLKISPITVGDGAWIGSNATVLGGVTIGSGSIVGAGSLVTKDVPPNTIVAGIPAKIIRTLE